MQVAGTLSPAHSLMKLLSYLCISTHSLSNTHTHAYIRHVPPPVPLSVLFSVFFMNPARQADAIFSTRGKSQRPVLVSPPSPPHLGPAPHRCHRRGRSLWGPPDHPTPPTERWAGRQPVMWDEGAERRPSDPLSLWFFHIASLDHVEAFKHKQAAPQRVQQSTVNMLHTRAQRLTCNTLTPSFIFLTWPLAPTRMQGVHIAPQIP